VSGGLWLPVLSALATHLPIYICWGVLVAVAISRWDRHPNVSLLAVLAVGGMFLLSVIGTAFSVTAPIWTREQGMSPSSMGVVFAVYGVVSSLLSAGLWGMVIAAIFGWRNSSPTSPRTLSSGA
jgi:hypothetical protein